MQAHIATGSQQAARAQPPMLRGWPCSSTAISPRPGSVGEPGGLASFVALAPMVCHETEDPAAQPFGFWLPMLGMVLAGIGQGVQGPIVSVLLTEQGRAMPMAALPNRLAALAVR